MNRKEAGYAIAGVLGALVGAGCSSTQVSPGAIAPPRADPPPAEDYSPIPLALVLSDTALSLFKRPDHIRVSTSIDRILRVLNSPGYAALRPLAKGQCWVYVKDTTTLVESRFDLDIGICKNGSCSEARAALDARGQDEPQLGLYRLELQVGGKNTFKKSPLYTASATNPSVCAIADTGDRLDLQIISKGGSKVILTNTATGGESSFYVTASG